MVKTLEEAYSAIEQAREAVDQDPYRPTFHACPPAFWMNDPNGLIERNGEYHLYFQHNPFEPKWGNIHWGHLKSRDLIHWEVLPIAMAPDQAYDKDGCYSGSSIEKDGNLYVFYTGNVWLPEGDPRGESIQTQNLAVSEDGLTFSKHPNNPLIPAPPEEVGDPAHFRDPKVWAHDGKWYMVLGTKKNQLGKVVLYRSDDLYDWKYVGVVTESDGSMGYMYECPDFFSLGDQEVLLFSPQGVGDEEQPDITGYYVGELDYESGRFQHGGFRRLDYGFNYYAPQSFEDEKGRRLLLGWMPMEPISAEQKWAGAMTVPRELTVTENGKLKIKPVDELKQLRGEALRKDAFEVTAGKESEVAKLSRHTGEFKVQFDLEKTEASRFGFQVSNGEEAYMIEFHQEDRKVVFDRSGLNQGPSGKRECPIEEKSAQLELHVIMDRCTVEVFINDGDYVMSGYVFPKELDEMKLSLFADGGKVHVSELNYWQYGL